MRRHLLSALLIPLLSVASAAHAQDWARKMFSEVSHDFGVVAKDAKVEYRFVFSNIYQEPVHVVGVRSSCGCTDPSVTKSDLKTYEKSEIVAKFNTRAFTGHHSATLTVTIDKPFYAEVQLNVWGEIRSDITVRPEQIGLGTVDQGQEIERRITITHSGKPDWKIVDVRSVNTNYEVEVVDGPRRNSQVSYDLVVKLKKDAPPGYVNDQLILVTNDPHAAQFPIEVEGLVNAELTATPQSLSFGAVEAGHKAIRPVIVRGRKPFKVTDVKCDDESFAFKIPEAANKIQTVAITFTAPDKAGPVVKKIRIETDLGKSFIAEVVVQAEVKPSTNPPATAAVTEKPALDKAAAKTEAKDDQKSTETPSETPTADKPVADKPSSEKPAADKRGATPPVTDKPVTDKRRAANPIKASKPLANTEESIGADISPAGASPDLALEISPSESRSSSKQSSLQTNPLRP